MSVSTTPFAKIFDLPGRPQLVAFLDPSADEPTLSMITSAAGVLAATNLTLDDPQAPVDSKRAVMAELLKRFDEEKAKEASEALKDSVNKHAPVVSFLNELIHAGDSRDHAFARFEKGFNGQQALLIRADKDGQPAVRLVTPTHSVLAEFSTQQERDEAFASVDRLQPFMPPAMLEELGWGQDNAPSRKPRTP